MRVEHNGGITIEENEMLTSIRRLILLLLSAFLLNLWGCSGKKIVTYIPPAERNLPNMQQAQEGVSVEALKNYFSGWIGTRYTLGGLSHDGVDCSGLTLLAYKELFDKELPRTVEEQVQRGTSVKKEYLRPGDLVFFKTGIFQRHVGIYLDDDLFVHASRSNGVMISRLDDTYWKNHYWKAKHIPSISIVDGDLLSSGDLQGSF